MAIAPTASDPLLGFMDALLTMVEDGAPLEHLDGTRREIRATLPTADARDRLDAIYTRALHLREALSERQRRELELRVLMDTAADLSARHDLDEVLAAICRRVRSLLSSDAAWITLIDPESGEAYHRMTDGIASEQVVRSHRFPIGTGLGGFVLETGNAEWTDDYLSDQRFTHSPPIDRSTLDEGLDAMLGAPMRRGDELLGAVMTANRGHRPFAAPQVTLLQTLADHAAIAISNARLLSDSKRASLEFREANETIRRHAEAVERSVELRNRLSQLVLDGTDLHELLVPVAEVLDGRVMLVDPEHRILATAGRARDDLDAQIADGLPFLDVDALPRPVAERLHEVMAHGRAAAVDANDEHLPRLLAPLLARREPLGVLVLTKGDSTETDLRLLASAALPLALSLANAHAQADAERLVRGELLDDLIAGRLTNPGAVARRSQRIGWKHEQTSVLLVVHPVGGDSRWVPLLASRFASERGGLMTKHDDTLVLLVPGRETRDVAHAAAKALQTRDGAAPTIAAAHAVPGYDGVPGAFTEAHRLLTLALALGRTGTTVLAESADGFGLIFGFTPPQQLQAFITRTLGPLIDYDRDHHSGLLTTLEAWFACDGHMRNTATRAHVHVNTLYKRMERVDELLGANWRTSDSRLQVQLALRLRSLAADIGERG